MKGYWAKSGPNMMAPPKSLSGDGLREAQGGGAPATPLDLTLAAIHKGGRRMEGARVPPSAYKYSPLLSQHTQGSLPPLLSPSPLRSCSVILERLGGRRNLFPPARRGAGGLRICLNLFRCSADPEIGRENLFAASPWYPRGATRGALIIGLSGNSTQLRRRRRLGFLDHACAGALSRLRSSRVWFRIHLCIRIYTSA